MNQALTPAPEPNEVLDAVYRERQHLLALRAVELPGAVITPAADMAAPGWQILYLPIGQHIATWHIPPRDAELFTAVEQVDARDPRAFFDGHSTEQKYARIRQQVTNLGERLPRGTRRWRPSRRTADAAALDRGRSDQRMADPHGEDPAAEE
ncbi:hypothetical protein [Streptomyces sp. G-5]|uniref:hypothetical protein n=1 Tax=Streptomyces sp. G-5 TaxID=2977231 RepID=UPI0021CE7669|nr:hypothetical protein [Streptomyces sp. G-5]MCU4750272.1 hypothetical protein [Streptomyces sp. G-5]